MGSLPVKGAEVGDEGLVCSVEVEAAPVEAVPVEAVPVEAAAVSIEKGRNS